MLAFQQIFGKFVRIGSSVFPWLLAAEVLANERKMNNELLLHVRSWDVSKERSFRKGIAFALLRLSKVDGDKRQINLIIIIWLLKMSAVQAHNWLGDTSGLVWLLATSYLHMVWLANKDYLPVFLEHLKWAWSFCVWTQLMYRSLGWVKLSPGNLLKWLETIRNLLHGCTNNSKRKYLASQSSFLFIPVPLPVFIRSDSILKIYQQDVIQTALTFLFRLYYPWPQLVFKRLIMLTKTQAIKMHAL